MGAALWFAFGSHRAPRGERALAPGDVPSSVGTIPENVESVEENAARPESVREAIEAPPEIPGPGQAMLLVEVVALETSEPLAGVELWLWTETDQGDKVAEPEHVVVTGEGGRAELVVVAGRAFDLGASATRAERTARDWTSRSSRSPKGRNGSFA